MTSKPKIVVINPNTTASMTDRIRLVSESVISDDFCLTVVNPSSGPASIEGYYDEAMSLAGLLDLVKQHHDAAGFVIACFDDTGLDAARCLTASPVVGIGEAAYHMASMISNKFGVVTTLSRSIPALEHNLVRYGLAARCSGVRASDIPVLEVEASNGTAFERINAEVEQAIKTDKAEAIVLGCAGMAELGATLHDLHNIPVLDGISCAIKQVEAMIYLNLKNSNIGGYAKPRQK
ncbi:MAG: aspartate/glutamate racemase family protein [Proteobacteria bacterium]|jgi:allantoin racemase|nr:aspartate/glutamate racemase family protein [Pseudomonadota bacterium]MDA9013474.1 aspartate/glutamate racemase family protein [Alphaproteobacteria bacterium]MDA9825392.1 aspartate/glutamate racemase family protein [Alphaproteobacteria bacterium]MDB0014488.1 aspartate/glutamate racemase family protein [Alphaproteobacteria bacterium]